MDSLYSDIKENKDINEDIKKDKYISLKYHFALLVYGSSIEWLKSKDIYKIIKRVGIDKIKAKDLAEADLEGLDLSGVDFTGVYIAGANLKNTGALINFATVGYWTHDSIKGVNFINTQCMMKRK